MAYCTLYKLCVFPVRMCVLVSHIAIPGKNSYSIVIHSPRNGDVPHRACTSSPGRSILTRNAHCLYRVDCNTDDLTFVCVIVMFSGQILSSLRSSEQHCIFPIRQYVFQPRMDVPMIFFIPLYVSKCDKQSFRKF